MPAELDEAPSAPAATIPATPAEPEVDYAALDAEGMEQPPAAATPTAPAAEQDVFTPSSSDKTPDQLIEQASARFQEASGVDYGFGEGADRKNALAFANAEKYTDEEKILFAEQITLSAQMFEKRVELEAINSGRTLEDVKKDTETMSKLRGEVGKEMSEVIAYKEGGKKEEFAKENGDLKNRVNELEVQVQAAEAKRREEKNETVTPTLGTPPERNDTQAPTLGGATAAQVAEVKPEEKSKDMYIVTETHLINKVDGAVSVYDKREGEAKEVLTLTKDETNKVIADLKALKESPDAEKQIEVLKTLGLGKSEEGKAAFTALAEQSKTMREALGIPDPADKEKFTARINELEQSLKPKEQEKTQDKSAPTVDLLAPASQIAQVETAKAADASDKKEGTAMDPNGVVGKAAHQFGEGLGSLIAQAVSGLKTAVKGENVTTLAALEAAPPVAQGAAPKVAQAVGK